MHSQRHNKLMPLIAAGCLVAISACGSSRESNGTPTSSDPLLKLAECMRSHGVPNFPDPTARGLVIPNDINTQSPAFESAQRSCRNLGSQPGQGGGGQRSASESQKLRMLALAKCVRVHGFSSFPDPTTTPPQPPLSGARTGNVIGIGGVYLALPPDSPAFRRAAAACGIP